MTFKTQFHGLSQSLTIALVFLFSSSLWAQEVPDSQALTRVAIRDFETEDIAERLAQIVHRSTVEEMRKYEKLSLISMDEVRELLQFEAEKQMTGCTEGSCLAELADALGADEIVVGSITVLADEQLFELKRISTAKAAVLVSKQVRVKLGNKDALLAAIGPLVRKLYFERRLKQGRVVGVDKAVALTLDPPPIPRWLTTSAFVGAGTLLIAGGAAATTNLLLISRYDDEVEKSREEGAEPVANAANRARVIDTSATLTWGFLGAGAAALAASSVMALFTDWRGYGDANVE